MPLKSIMTGSKVEDRSINFGKVSVSWDDPILTLNFRIITKKMIILLVLTYIQSWPQILENTIAIQDLLKKCRICQRSW